MRFLQYRTNFLDYLLQGVFSKYINFRLSWKLVLQRATGIDRNQDNARGVVTTTQSEKIRKWGILCSYWRCNLYRFFPTWISHEFDVWKTIGQLPSFRFLPQFSKQILRPYSLWFMSSVLIDRMCFFPWSYRERTLKLWEIFRSMLSDIYCSKSFLFDSQ